MDVFSEGHIVAVVKRWHATSCPLFGVDRQYVHFGSKCHISKLSHGTKCRKDEPCGVNCHVDVLRGGRIVKASATPLLEARTRMLDISNRKLQSHWGHVYAAKRYTKKPRQTLVSSSLDSLGLSAAVAHVFRLQKTSLMDSWGRGDRVCALYCRFLIKNKWKWTVLNDRKDVNGILFNV